MKEVIEMLSSKMKAEIKKDNAWDDALKSALAGFTKNEIEAAELYCKATKANKKLKESKIALIKEYHINTEANVNFFSNKFETYFAQYNEKKLAVDVENVKKAVTVYKDFGVEFTGR